MVFTRYKSNSLLQLVCHEHSFSSINSRHLRCCTFVQKIGWLGRDTKSGGLKFKINLFRTNQFLIVITKMCKTFVNFQGSVKVLLIYWTSYLVF